jgi:hypothetical protein
VDKNFKRALLEYGAYVALVLLAFAVVTVLIVKFVDWLTKLTGGP